MTLQNLLFRILLNASGGLTTYRVLLGELLLILIVLISPIGLPIHVLTIFSLLSTVPGVMFRFGGKIRWHSKHAKQNSQHPVCGRLCVTHKTGFMFRALQNAAYTSVCG